MFRFYACIFHHHNHIHFDSNPIQYNLHSSLGHCLFRRLQSVYISADPNDRLPHAFHVLQLWSEISGQEKPKQCRRQKVSRNQTQTRTRNHWCVGEGKEEIQGIDWVSFSSFLLESRRLWGFVILRWSIETGMIHEKNHRTSIFNWKLEEHHGPVRMSRISCFRILFGTFINPRVSFPGIPESDRIQVIKLEKVTIKSVNLRNRSLRAKPKLVKLLLFMFNVVPT